MIQSENIVAQFASLVGSTEEIGEECIVVRSLDRVRVDPTILSAYFTDNTTELTRCTH